LIAQPGAYNRPSIAFANGVTSGFAYNGTVLTSVNGQTATTTGLGDFYVHRYGDADTTGMRFYSAEGVLTIETHVYGAGRTGGRLLLGRNSHGGGAPGTIHFIDKDGGHWLMWVDTSGKLRLAQNVPATPESGDTGGVVVGTQT
jgi:hypothetical protein